MTLFNNGIPRYMLGMMLLVPSAALMVACWMCPCVWLWKRWKRDPGACEGVRRVRQNVSVEFVIPESVVGFVIGRRGASVKQVEEESGARVQFKDQQGTKDKVVVITGRPVCVQSAQELIQTAVDEKLSSTRNQQTLTLTLPQKAVGRVIGRQGANIRSIQRESGAKVSMMSGGQSEAVRLCEVVGSSEQLARAVALIQELVAQSEKPRPPTHKRPSVARQTTPHPREIEPLELRVSTEYAPVFVSSVDGHGGVWVQPIGQEDPNRLEALVQEMTKYYNSSSDGCPGNARVGDVFAATFEHDSSWYRVGVSSVECEGVKQVEVVYLDYGDYATVDLSSLRPLKAEYYTLKAQAVRCLLHSVIPTGGVWSEAALELLEELTHSATWKVVMGRIVSTQITPTIQLVDTSSDQDIDIAEKLVSSGHTQWAKPHPPFPRSLRYRRDGQHQLLPIRSHVTFPDQSDCSVYVTHVQSPDLVFVVAVGYELLLTQLCEKLNTAYDQSDESLLSVDRGQWVAASFPLDKQWYRGHVISFNQSDTSVLVRLVDYGVVVCLPLTQLRPLKQEFCEEMVYSVPCALSDVKAAGEAWSEEACQFVREATSEGEWVELNVTLTGRHSNIDEVSTPAVILESLDKDDTSVNTELVARGLAKEVKVRPAPDGGEECDGREIVRQRSVKFQWSGAGEVSVAGSFSEWKEVKLKRRSTGEFEADMELPQGTHEYKYLVDGTWQHDHSQPTRHNSYGTLNNVLSD